MVLYKPFSVAIFLLALVSSLYVLLERLCDGAVQFVTGTATSIKHAYLMFF
jgi:hypothetical protein